MSTLDLLHPQLAAFAAVLEEGSFDLAARRLSVTPSAISQRIKALEDRLGQVLVIRHLPCRPTPAGEALLRRVRPMQALQAEALAELLPAGSRPARGVAIAVNADSLHTWFVAALAPLHSESGMLFDIRVEDQDHTLDLLRDGSVLGAVTAEARPVQGCNVLPLGVMRYQAIASADLVARHFADGVHARSLAAAPMIVFNRKDALQWRFVRGITRARLRPPMHYLPSATGFVDAAALGLGWCLAPESLLVEPLRAKRVVLLAPGRHLDVPLYWQYAAVRSSTLDAVGRALRAAAAASLR